MIQWNYSILGGGTSWLSRSKVRPSAGPGAGSERHPGWRGAWGYVADDPLFKQYVWYVWYIYIYIYIDNYWYMIIQYDPSDDPILSHINPYYHGDDQPASIPCRVQFKSPQAPAHGRVDVRLRRIIIPWYLNIAMRKWPIYRWFTY